MQIFYHKKTGQAAVFADDENISDWSDYQETQPDPNEEEIRSERNALLNESDKEMMKIFDEATSWANLETLRSDWKTYRQALRDVPTQDGFPGNVVWPTKPT